MSRVITPASAAPETARHRHTCNAEVEFVRTDVMHDRDGFYVVCPYCNKPPFISTDVLVWRK